MKRIALVSHCVLNSFCEKPEASDTFRKQIFNILTDKKISIVQLPCPELCYQALERESITPGSENADEYMRYCEKLLEPLIHNLKEYDRHDIKTDIIIGINTSPSCSVEDYSAIMTKLLLEKMSAEGINAETLIDMPVSGDGESFFHILRNL